MSRPVYILNKNKKVQYIGEPANYTTMFGDDYHFVQKADDSGIIHCPLVRSYSLWQSTFSAPEPWMKIEAVFENSNSYLIGVSQSYDDEHNFELFWVNNSLYFDYMKGDSASSTGSGFSRLQLNFTELESNTSIIYKISALTIKSSETAGTKHIVVYNYSNNQIIKQTSTGVYAKKVYTPSSIPQEPFGFGLKSTTTYNTFYYIKVFHQDNSLACFFHWKLDNGQYKLYDEVSKTFCNLLVDNSSLDVVYPDKYIDLETT